MAIKIENDSSQNAPDPQQTQQAPTIGGAPAAPGNSGSSVTQLMHLFGSASSLGSHVDAYLEQVRENLEKMPQLGKEIKIVRLSDPTGAHAFIYRDVAIVITFADLVPSEPLHFIPVSAFGANAVNALHTAYPGDAQGNGKLRILNHVLIHRTDYDRAQQFAQYISHSFMVATDSNIANTTIDAFNGDDFVIDPDVMATRQFINSLSVHGVAPRIDVGFILYQKTRQISRGQGIQLDDMKPIMAVGAYTEMVIDHHHQYSHKEIRYIPTVRITAIQSLIPLGGIIPLALALAADQFTDGPGRQSRWRQQFNTFVKGKPNIGNLSPGIDGKGLWFAPDATARDEWISQNCIPAVLAIDVVEGQARIPSIASYGIQASHYKIGQHIAHFFNNGVVVNTAMPPCQVINTDHIGLFGDNGGALHDSREIDYLSLTASQGTQDVQSQNLLKYYSDPAIRARVIAEKTGGSFKSMYACYTSVLSSQLLQALCQYVVTTLRINSQQGINHPMATDWLRAQAEFNAQSNFSATRHGSQQPSGYNMNYSY